MTPSAAGIARRLEQILGDAGPDSGAGVRDVRIGVRYTAVAVGRGCGVAYSVSEQPVRSCAHFDGARPLAARSGADLIRFLRSPHPVETAVGLAAANALANRARSDLTEGDILEFVRLNPGDDVAMVGHFGPLVAPVKARVRSLRILERVQRPQGDLIPVERAPEVLGSSQVALITSSSLINHSIDVLLEEAENCREVVLLGASTPLVPEAFRGTPVTCLSGIVVEDTKSVLRVVGEAGGMRQLSPFVRKVNLPLVRT